MYSNTIALWLGVCHHQVVEFYIHMHRLWQKSRKQAAVISLLYIAFFGFLFVTDPNKLPIGWLLVPFVLLFSAIFSTLIYVQRRKSDKQTGVPAKRYAIAAILAAIPTFLLLLDSINQLTLGDALIFCVFAVVALFYVRKLSFASRT